MRSEKDKNGERIISGYAIVFNQRSELLGNFYEYIDKNSLDDVDLSDVKCLVNHDYSKILGGTKSDTLFLKVDEKGLKFSVRIPETSYGNDIYESVRRGDINQCSFSFIIDDKDATAQEITRLEKGVYERTVKKIDKLIEVSVVTIPAYKQTTAEIERDYQHAVNQFEKSKLELELELINLD